MCIGHILVYLKSVIDFNSFLFFYIASMVVDLGNQQFKAFLLAYNVLCRCSSFDSYGNSIEDGYSGSLVVEKAEILNMLELYENKKARNDISARLFPMQNLIGTMEKDIWKEFPEVLFEAVIARLPIAAIFRFRSVCQKWNSMLASSSFVQHFAEVRRMNPWFCAIVHDVADHFNSVSGGAMYDPSQKRWHRPSLPLIRWKKTITAVTSAGGLVCLSDVNHKHFYICNPLIKSVKVLPPRSARMRFRVLVGMVLSENRTGYSSYKVVWLGCNGYHAIYDSTKKSWKYQWSLPESIKTPLSLNFRSQTVCIDTIIYFMQANPDGILTYDVATGVWKQFIIPLPVFISDYFLAVCEGKVMLVGLLSKNAATCVCIWELQKMTLLWKEVDRMPNILCLEFYGKHVKMMCMGNQGMLMLSLRSRKINLYITYDLRKREWQKVPNFPLPLDGRKQWLSCGAAFYPCPAALP
ncbi:F-box only protein 6 [Apostasia shenzhenica]|uniref:F-box only protein 6 n=1 Tax=Apostasia shenzhenica TaxID=1088818 RepID=A0A2I0AI70_9ASPA|nr:F-box only protein 6 [Apostasia shenzhenica]